jgi:hypothetical protein
MKRLKDIHKFRNITYSNDYFGADLFKDYFYISILFGINEWGIFNNLEFLIGYRDRIFNDY